MFAIRLRRAINGGGLNAVRDIVRQVVAVKEWSMFHCKSFRARLIKSSQAEEIFLMVALLARHTRLKVRR